MTARAHGQIRRSQVITTYGPGALIDLPRYSAIVGGLETWPKTSDLEEIVESRLTRKLQIMTGITVPRLYAPPPEPTDPKEPARGIGAWRFPEWFVIQEEGGTEERERSRRLVNRKFQGHREGILLILRDITRDSISSYWQQTQQLVCPGLDRCEVRHLFECQAQVLRLEPVGNATARRQLRHQRLKAMDGKPIGRLMCGLL